MPTTQLAPTGLPGRRYVLASFVRLPGVPEGVLEARGPTHVPPPLRPFLPVIHRARPVVFVLGLRLAMRFGRAHVLAAEKALSPFGGARLVLPMRATVNMLSFYSTLRCPRFSHDNLVVSSQPMEWKIPFPSTLSVKGRLLMGGRRQALIASYYELLEV